MNGTCIHLSDEFTAVCVSADCPVCGDGKTAARKPLEQYKHL